MRAFLKRPFEYFLSYSHADGEFAKHLKNWLANTAGLRIWFDELDLQSGGRVQADIASSIGQCQGIIFLISKNSLSSKSVQDEIDQALAEKKEHSDFQIVLLHMDDCDIPSQCKSIRHMKWIELATPEGPKLSLVAAAELLCRVHAYDGWQRRQQELKEVYVSRGWRNHEEDYADQVCRQFARHELRLVGDLPNQDKSDPLRVVRIMRGCWGHILILPERSAADGSQSAYKHFLQELEVSTSLGVPRIVIAEPDCDLPQVLAERAVTVRPELLKDQTDSVSNLLSGHIYEFVENLSKPQTEVHAFLASEFEGNEERNRLARAVVEATGTLPCYWGKDYRDMSVQSIIHDALVSAKFVVADLTSNRWSSNSTASTPAANVNACIEAAIAWGADVPVFCFAAENPNASVEGKTKHVPFMFRYAQLDLYQDSAPSFASGVVFLGAVHKAVLDNRTKFGRRVINYEL